VLDAGSLDPRVWRAGQQLGELGFQSFAERVEARERAFAGFLGRDRVHTEAIRAGAGRGLGRGDVGRSANGFPTSPALAFGGRLPPRELAALSGVGPAGTGEPKLAACPTRSLACR